MGKKLTVYLIDGNQHGPRTIEIGNWSGKAVYSPRSVLSKMLNRDEYDNPGVYILKSDPIEDIYPERIYIGEAENVRDRLKQHLSDSNKDFKECIIFISKDELLTKSHIKYIESKLIQLAREAKNSEIENSNSPSLTTLSEADISDMEYFIKQIRLILPIANYSFLITNLRKEKAKVSELDVKEELIFSMKNKNYNAKMLEKDEGFVVLKGSEANKSAVDSISDGWRKLREKLKKNESLIEKNGKLIFTEDIVFSSPSAASSVVLGRQSPGPLLWIDSNGKSLKDYETEDIQY